MAEVMCGVTAWNHGLKQWEHVLQVWGADFEGGISQAAGAAS